MKSKKSLFVLGAGASKPFGFPTGDELRLRIIAEPKTRRWLGECNFDESECDRFVEEFKRSGFSIDAFLARRAEFDKIGMVAIAAALRPLEEDARLYLADGQPGNSDWYQRLWLRLVGTTTDAGELQQRNLKVITFNYDRSFERYLHLTAMSGFGLDRVKAYQAVKPFFPYHVYGKLGPYHPNTSFPAPSSFEVVTAVEDLKVMPSTRPDSDQTCTDLFAWADQVFFVGFSFDPMNCSRLGLAEVMKSRLPSSPRPLEVYATGVGLNEQEMRAASRATTGRADTIAWTPDTGLGAIRNWAPLLE